MLVAAQYSVSPETGGNVNNNSSHFKLNLKEQLVIPAHGRIALLNVRGKTPDFMAVTNPAAVIAVELWSGGENPDASKTQPIYGFTKSGDIRPSDLAELLTTAFTGLSGNSNTLNLKCTFDEASGFSFSYTGGGSAWYVEISDVVGGQSTGVLSNMGFSYGPGSRRSILDPNALALTGVLDDAEAGYLPNRVLSEYPVKDVGVSILNLPANSYSTTTGVSRQLLQTVALPEIWNSGVDEQFPVPTYIELHNDEPISLSYLDIRIDTLGDTSDLVYIQANNQTYYNRANQRYSLILSPSIVFKVEGPESADPRPTRQEVVVVPKPQLRLVKKSQVE